MRRRLLALAKLAGCAVLWGCSGNLKLPQIELPATGNPVIGTPTELYTRIARGALTCWFGQDGPLKSDYIYSAEAEPASKGGKSEIIIHAREKASPAPRGVRVFRITVTPNGERAQLDVENLKLAEPLGARMKTDVDRWAAGEIGCASTEGASGWAPKRPDDLLEEPGPSSKKPIKPQGRKI